MTDFPLSTIGYSLLINNITDKYQVCVRCPHFNGNCIDYATKGQCKALPADIHKYSEISDDDCVKVVDNEKGLVEAKFYTLPSQTYSEPRYQYTTYCRLTREELNLSSEASDEEYYDIQDKYVTEFVVPLSALEAFVDEYDCYYSISGFDNSWTWDDAETLYNFCRWNEHRPVLIITEVTKEK